MTAAASSGCRLLQALAAAKGGAPSRALIRRPNCSDSVGISGSQRPQRPPVGRSGGAYNGIPRGEQQWAVGRACRVQPTYIQTACRKCAVGAWDAIGCHGTSPRDGWAAMGQSGGRGRSHPPQNTARWSVLVALRAENEDSWTTQVAAVVTMHEVDGTDMARAERAPILDLSWACPALAVDSAPHYSKSSVRSSYVQRKIQCLTSDVGSICSAPCC